MVQSVFNHPGHNCARSKLFLKTEIRKIMKTKKIIMITAAFAAILLSGLSAVAQVKRVQMHIAGYLCGN